MQRRDFLQSSLLASSLTSFSGTNSIVAKPVLEPKIKLSVSSYSYWHFKGEQFPIEKVIDDAAALGLEGIDILHRQMKSEDNAYMQNIKKHAFLNGIALTCLSIHQGFVTPDKEELKKHVDHTIHCIELAYKMAVENFENFEIIF